MDIINDNTLLSFIILIEYMTLNCILILTYHCKNNVTK